MSVITNKAERHAGSGWKPGTKCTVCKWQLHHPFVEWIGSDLFICAKCCVEVKNGLMADMVHCAAIQELDELGYRGVTLVRKTVKQVEQDELDQIAAEQQAWTKHCEEEQTWRDEKARYARPPKVK